MRIRELTNICPKFQVKLKRAQKISGVLFQINSGYRSPEHPLSIKNPTSSHIKGLAVDIAVNSSRGRFIVLQALIKIGFNRIGIGSNFIHVDDDRDKSQRVVWLY